MENVKNVTFDEIQVGAKAECHRTPSQPDIELFALVSGDVDPLHLTGEEAISVRRDARSTEALGAQAIIAAALGTRLPRPGLTILHRDLRYHGMIRASSRFTEFPRQEDRHGAGNRSAQCRIVEPEILDLL